MERGGIRVGIGYDSHPLVSGRRLVLGGVDVPYGKGLLGWSDADVVTHAIIDALCGAAELGDIGTLFSSQELEYKDISSLILLGKTSELVKGKGFRVANIDVNIVAQSPKLSPFIPEMRKRISQSLGVESNQVTIKATTTDGLGFIGREEGMAAQSVALVQKIES
jgi:2-C-methyl-D-erythritol 2,4-cyclodiphosphate synthase